MPQPEAPASGRARRDIPSLDYRKLNSTGVREVKARYRSPQPSEVADSSSADSSQSTSTLSPSDSEPGYTSQGNLFSDVFEAFIMEDGKDSGDEVKVKTELQGLEEEMEELEVVREEFADFLDENCIDVTVMNAEDFDAYVARMEDYRRTYKALERKLKKKADEVIYRQYFKDSFFRCFRPHKRMYKRGKSKESETKGKRNES